MENRPDPLLTLTEVGVLREVVVKRPAEAFVSAERAAREWRALNFTGPPDLARASEEYEHFLRLVSSRGAEPRFLPADPTVQLDSIYTRDASILTPAGIVLCRMGKSQRDAEPDAQRRAFADWHLPIAGAITPPARLEGGDVVWLGSRTVAVGRGYRTNDDGIAQLRRLLGDAIDRLIVVPLPHWRGHGDVFHLMSVVSPVDRDLAAVYSPLMPVPFREALIDLGYQLVEVPDEEFDSMGANVLAIAPRCCVALAGNPQTRARLEHAGAEVLVYEGNEISLKGGGGPTCLTRPLVRSS